MPRRLALLLAPVLLLAAACSNPVERTERFGQQWKEAWQDTAELFEHNFLNVHEDDPYSWGSAFDGSGGGISHEAARLFLDVDDPRREAVPRESLIDPDQGVGFWDWLLTR